MTTVSIFRYQLRVTHFVWEVPSAPLDCFLPLADEPVKDAKRGVAVYP